MNTLCHLPQINILNIFIQLINIFLQNLPKFFEQTLLDIPLFVKFKLLARIERFKTIKVKVIFVPTPSHFATLQSYVARKVLLTGFRKHDLTVSLH